MCVQRIVLQVVAICVLVASTVSAQAVPSEYGALHDELFLNLSGFRSGIHQAWDGSRAPVAFSAGLVAAHSSRGSALLAPGMADSIVREIDSLKALGVGAITLHIGFPMLHRPFHRSEDEYQRYVEFYVQLAHAVRARGLTLVVSTPATFSDGIFSPLDVATYYASLTPAQYRQGRMEVARTIASELRPDYLSVITEPDTEAEQSGKAEMGTVEGSRALLDVILAGLQAAAVPGVAVGAGIGTWQQDYRSYVESFASTAIDFVDMHIYAIGSDYLARALEIADVAAGYGKQVGMTETWLYKATSAESDLPPSWVFRRDVFSFWGPLDGLHLQTMVEMAHFKRFAFISPYWTGYLRAYVDYNDTTKNQNWPALSWLAQSAWSTSMRAGEYSLSGLAYRDALVVPPDVTPPTTPADVAVQVTARDAVAVTWSPATDAVGTAAYIVRRDGDIVERTALTHFVDTGLAEATSYVYSVTAVDASNNASSPASATVTTPDFTPPAMPQNLTAAVVPGANRLDVALSWQPSADNVGVTQYVVTRGTAPDAMTPIAATTGHSYTIGNERPDTTFYYGVKAIDAGWNISTEAVTSLTTPPLPDVTPPVVRITYPADGATVYRTLYLYGLTYDIMGGSYDVPSGPVALRLFIDGVPVGNELTDPYIETPQYSVFELQTSTSSLSKGEHVLTAVARDAAGNTATSSPIRIRVSRSIFD
jgi:hypothetical protein